MADIALATANVIEVIESISQLTTVAAEAVTAGAPVYINTDGKFANADANGVGDVGCYGIALRTAGAGEALTAMRNGVIGGLTLTNQAFGAQLFLSNTVGRIADAAGATEVVLGSVIPATDVPLGTAFNKLMLVEVQSSGRTGAQS